MRQWLNRLFSQLQPGTFFPAALEL